MSIEAIYDYIILTVTNPAFSDNVDLMIINGLKAGGTSPTIITKTIIDDSDPENPTQITKPIQAAMVGTKEVAGRIMLYFRLPVKLNEAELEGVLQQGMTNPKPPLSVESIRSAFKTVWINDGLDEDGNPIGHYEYDTVMQADKSIFLPYMTDVNDGIDQNGDPIMRPPNMGDDLYLSHYFGVEPLKL